jgi:hypothetical protein
MAAILGLFAVAAAVSQAYSESSFVALSPATTKDIWTTSVYSYAPGGGGPGGGREDDRLRVGGYGDEYDALIQFPLPTKNCRAKVTLSLFNQRDDGRPTAFYLYVIKQPWSWKRGDRLWWRDRPTATPWKNRVIAAPGINQWTLIDLTDLFQEWCSGRLPNYGVMLRPVENGNTYNNFVSTRGAADKRPRLIIGG